MIQEDGKLLSKDASFVVFLVLIVVSVERYTLTHYRNLFMFASQNSLFNSSPDLYVGQLSLGRLQHSQADTTHMLDTRLVPAVNAACDGSCTVVVEIVVKRAVASTEALILQEERVVEKCKGVENVEIGLSGSAWNQYLR